MGMRLTSHLRYKRGMNDSSNRLLLAFFLLTFAFSWSVWGAAALASHGYLAWSPSLAMTGLLGTFGPSLAALAVTAVSGGRIQLKQLLCRLLRWRVGLRWYGLALLALPALTLLALAVEAIFSQRPLDLTRPPLFQMIPLPPEAAGVSPWFFFLPIFLQQMLFSSPLGEEIGWRGFALPRLQAQAGPLVASLVIGLIWAIWHLPLTWTAGHPLANMHLAQMVVAALLFTWLYNGSGGSLLLVILFHTSMNVTGLFLPAPAAPLLLGLHGLLALVALTQIYAPAYRPVEATNKVQ
jgi:uncharacterized protein